MMASSNTQARQQHLPPTAKKSKMNSSSKKVNIAMLHQNHLA